MHTTSFIWVRSLKHKHFIDNEAQKEIDGLRTKHLVKEFKFAEMAKSAKAFNDFLGLLGIIFHVNHSHHSAS